MAKLPAGWIFIPKMKDAVTITVEKRELVVCKDCKWYHQAFANEGRCVNHDNDFHNPDWFCADGKRTTE